MPPLTVAAALTQIGSGRLAPLYLLVGDDEIGKAGIVDAVVSTIDEDLRAFNVERFYADEAEGSALRILEAARTLPMMAARRIIVVLRADGLLVPKRDTDRAQRSLEALEDYMASPEPHAVLLLVGTKPDGRSRLVKQVLQRAVVVQCGDLDDAGEAAAWVRARFGEAGVQVDPAAVRLLVERAGADAARLRADVDRLVLYVEGRGRVSLADVEEVAGPAVSRDPWAMTNAIEAGAVGDALRELALMLEEGEVAPKILGQLRWVVSARLPPARAAAAVDALFRTDLALKSSGGDPRVLLERLVVELCGTGDGRRARAPGRARF